MIKMCCCYVSADAGFLLEVKACVRGAEQFVSWHNAKIPPGTKRLGEVVRLVQTADLILLLISPGFLEAMSSARLKNLVLERQRSGAAEVVALILRPVKWQESGLSQLPILPDWHSRGYPLTQFTQSHDRSLVITTVPFSLYLLISKLVAEQADRQWTPAQDHCPMDGGNRLRMFITQQGEYVFGCPSCCRLWHGGRGRLSIEAGQQQGEVYELRRLSVTIGQSRECAIVLADGLAAKVSARLICWEDGDGTYRIRAPFLSDWGEASGVMLNGRMLKQRESQPLQDGDRLVIGETVLVYHQQGEVQASS